MDEAIKTFFRSITIISKDKKKERKGCATPKLEVEHIIRIIAKDTRMLVAHGMPKLHKGKENPPPHRPAIAVLGSPFHYISRCVEWHLRPLLDQMNSRVKNSNNTGLMIRALNELDDNLFLFTEDAKEMFPKINTEEGLAFLTISLDILIFKVESN